MPDAVTPDFSPLSERRITKRPYRIAYLVSHPIQYQAPLLRLLSSDPQIDLTAFFLSDFSLHAYQDQGFGTEVRWGVPLLEGYKSVFLPALGGNALHPPLLPFSQGLERHLRAGRFDALWLHGYAHTVNLRALIVAKQLGMKVFVRSDAHLGSLVGGSLARVAKDWFLPLLFRQVDAFLSCGSLNTEYYRRYGVPGDKIWLLPYAVDNEFFQTQARIARPEREALRLHLGLDPARPVILFASKFSRRKRACDLLEAYVRLSPDGRRAPDPYLLFVGDGEERDALEARIAALGWSSIKILGFKNQAEMPRFFDLCDVFVLPSEKEPWGLVVNEAMNASCPIIVSDQIGAAPDLVRDGGNGFVFPTGDVPVLSDRLRLLCGDAVLRQRMGACSLSRIREWGFTQDLLALRDVLQVMVPLPSDHSPGDYCPAQENT